MKIVIAHGHGLLSIGLREALEQDGGFVIVAELQGSEAVSAVVAAVAPDVVLLDAPSSARESLDLLGRLHREHPDVMFVMCSVPPDHDLIQLALRSGACGCLLNSINPKDIASAIRHAVHRTAYHAIGAPKVDADEVVQVEGLTRRESQAMRAASRGLSNKEIADELCVSVFTVKSHLASVYRKLGVSNRTEAAAWARS